jgi:hypothetical protein
MRNPAEEPVPLPAEEPVPLPAEEPVPLPAEEPVPLPANNQPRLGAHPSADQCGTAECEDCSMRDCTFGSRAHYSRAGCEPCKAHESRVYLLIRYTLHIHRTERTEALRSAGEEFLVSLLNEIRYVKRMQLPRPRVQSDEEILQEISLDIQQDPEAPVEATVNAVRRMIESHAIPVA